MTAARAAGSKPKKGTTRSRVRRSTAAGRAGSLGAETTTVSLYWQAKALLGVVRPLLELFSVVDDVFQEDGAFDEDKLKVSLGRVYRAWKETRRCIDPDFDSRRYRQSR